MIGRRPAVIRFVVSCRGPAPVQMIYAEASQSELVGTLGQAFALVTSSYTIRVVTVTRRCKGLQAGTERYKGLQSVTQRYKGSQAVTQCYKGLKAVTRSYKGLQAVTERYKGLQAVIRRYKGSQAVTQRYKQLHNVTIGHKQLYNVTSSYTLQLVPSPPPFATLFEVQNP